MIKEPRPVHFYFDLSSPYSYIATAWNEALAARHGRTERGGQPFWGNDRRPQIERWLESGPF